MQLNPPCGSWPFEEPERVRPPIWRAVVLLSSYRRLLNGVIMSVEHRLQVALFVEDLAADFVEG